MYGVANVRNVNEKKEGELLFHYLYFLQEMPLYFFGNIFLNK